MPLTLASQTLATVATIQSSNGASLAAWLPAVVMIAGIIVLGVIMMRMFHQRERKLQALAGQIASDLEEARALRQQLDETHARVTTLLGATQRLGGRLDERVASLDLASLKMHATRTSLPRPATATPTTAPHHATVRQAPAAAVAMEERAQAPAVARAPSVATIEAKPSLDPLTRQVYALADAGRSPLHIARDLNEQVGKIELILALRRQAM